MTKSLKLWKVLGATFLSVGAISISAAAVTHGLLDNIDEAKADVDYSTANSYHNAGNAWSLFTTLQTLSYTSTTKSYSDLWTVYNNAFVKSNGKMMDYYSNASSFTPTTNKCGSYTNEGDCYNREHSIPKSWWGSAEKKQGADPFIVIPTDGKVNGMRSNYPLGVVNSATYTSANNYSKLGSAVTSWGYTGTVFEPNDEVKGDLARVHFYAAVRYSSSSSGYDSYPTYNWTSGEGSSTFNGAEPTQSNSSNATSRFCLTNYAIKLFTAWNELDPPSEWEQSVNSNLYSIMGNKNPFIDHPEYVNTLFSGVTGATTYTGSGSSTPSTDPSATITGTTSVQVGNTTTLTAALSNVTSTSNITWESSDTSVATVSKGTTSTSSSVATVTGVAAGSATISCKHSGTTIGSTTVTVTSSGGGSGTSGTYSITFSTSGSDSSTALDTSGLLNLASSNTLVSSFTNATKCYAGTSGVKFGSSSATGSFTATPVSDAQSNVSSITIKSTKYGSDTGTLTLSVNGSSVKTGITPGTDNTYTPSSPISVSSFGIATSAKRAYVGEVSFVVGSSSSSDPSATITGTTSVQVGNTTTLTAALSNVTSTSNITWESSDTSVATVSKGTTSTSSSVATVTGVAAGSATISCKHSGTTLASKTVTVTASATLSSISVSTAPTKTTYTAGETFDPTGLVITRTYSNSTSDTYAYAGHTSEFSFSPSTSTALTTANTSVTITYNSKTCSQAITVNASGGSSSSDSYYEKVTADSGLESGKYLIVYETGSVAFNGGLTTLDATSNTISVTISSSKITSTTTVDAAQFTYNKSANTLKSASGYYIGQTSDSNGLKSSTSTSYENTVSVSSGDANIVSGDAYLRYNSASDQARFRYFKSSSYSNQQAVQLYKYVDESASTSASLELNKTAAQLDLNGTKTTTITATASGGSGSVAWASDDPTVATVSASSGTSITVTGKKVGTTTITASYNGDCTATCSITVVDSTFPYSTGVGYAMSYTDSSATRYFKGSMSGYYGETSTSISDGMTMYFETNGTGYNLYFKDTSSNKQYITVAVSGTHYNFTMSTSTPSSVWKYDGTNLYYTVSSVNYIIGGKGTFGTFSGYLATDSAAFGATFTAIQTAETWGASFLTTVTCNNGVTAPSTSAWNTMKTQFEALSTYEQNIVTSTSPNELGSTSLEQALARYAEILSKYPNRTSYPDYLYNPSSANQMSRTNNGSSSATIILLTVGILSSFAGFAFVGYWLKKKREY